MDRLLAGGAGLRHHLPPPAAPRDYEVLLPAPHRRQGVRVDRGHDRLGQHRVHAVRRLRHPRHRSQAGQLRHFSPLLLLRLDERHHSGEKKTRHIRFLLESRSLYLH